MRHKIPDRSHSYSYTVNEAAVIKEKQVLGVWHFGGSGTYP